MLLPEGKTMSLVVDRLVLSLSLSRQVLDVAQAGFDSQKSF